MALQLGDTAPNFSAETTQGKIDFHQFIGDGWAVLFSHPANFTPVCTTELAEVARLKPEFDKRKAKVIGLSVDELPSHAKWEKDIEETQGQAVNFPIIADSDRAVSDLYGMKIGRASCRERVCQSEVDMVGGRLLNKQKTKAHPEIKG